MTYDQSFLQDLISYIEMFVFSMTLWISLLLCRLNGLSWAIGGYIGIVGQPLGVYVGLWAYFRLWEFLGYQPDIGLGRFSSFAYYLLSSTVMPLSVAVLVSICAKRVLRNTTTKRLQFNLKFMMLAPLITWGLFRITYPMCFMSPHSFGIDGFAICDRFYLGSKSMMNVSGQHIDWTVIDIGGYEITIPITAFAFASIFVGGILVASRQLCRISCWTEYRQEICTAIAIVFVLVTLPINWRVMFLILTYPFGTVAIVLLTAKLRRLRINRLSTLRGGPKDIDA